MGIGVNLIIGNVQDCRIQFPLLLKEGWPGTIDYLAFTMFYFPAGVVDLFRNKSTSAEAVLWNGN